MATHLSSSLCTVVYSAHRRPAIIGDEESRGSEGMCWLETNAGRKLNIANVKYGTCVTKLIPTKYLSFLTLIPHTISCADLPIPVYSYHILAVVDISLAQRAERS